MFTVWDISLTSESIINLSNFRAERISAGLMLCFALAKRLACSLNPSFKKGSVEMCKGDLKRLIVISLHLNSHLGDAEAKDRGEMFSCQH